MNDSTGHDSHGRTHAHNVFLALLALAAPFNFVFPGSVWEKASADERRLIRRFMIVGSIIYLLILIVLFG